MPAMLELVVPSRADPKPPFARWSRALSGANPEAVQPVLKEILRHLDSSPPVEGTYPYFEQQIFNKIVSLSFPDDAQSLMNMRQQIVVRLLADRRQVLYAIATGCPLGILTEDVLGKLSSPRDVIAACVCNRNLIPSLGPKLARMEGRHDALIEASDVGLVPIELWQGQLASMDAKVRYLHAAKRMAGTLAGHGGTEMLLRSEARRTLGEVHDVKTACEVIQIDPKLAELVAFETMAAADVIKIASTHPLVWNYLPESKRKNASIREGVLARAPDVITNPGFRRDWQGVLSRMQLLELARFDGDNVSSSPGDWSLLKFGSPELQTDVAFLDAYLSRGGAATSIAVGIWTPRLMETAVIQNAQALRTIPQDLWTVDLVETALKNTDRGRSNLDRLGPLLGAWVRAQSNEDELRLLKANANLLHWANTRWFRDAGLAEWVAKHQGAALIHFESSVRRPFVMAGIRTDPSLISKLEPTDPDFHLWVAEALAVQPSVLATLPRRAVVTRPNLFELGLPGLAYRSGAPKHTLSEDVRIEHVHEHVGAVTHFRPDQKRSPQTMARAVRAFPPLLDELPEGAVPRHILVTLFPDLAKEAARYRLALSSLGIRDPFRLGNRATLDAVIARRRDLGASCRESLLVVDAFSDHNLALRQSDLPALAEVFDVFYFQQGLDTDVIATWRSLLASGASLRAVVIRGHANHRALALDAPDPAQSAGRQEQRYLDLTDEDELRYALLGLSHPDGAEVFVVGCSGGRGENKRPNLVNMLAKATGLPTFGAITPTPNGVRVSDAGDLEASFAKANTYAVTPSKVPPK